MWSISSFRYRRPAWQRGSRRVTAILGITLLAATSQAVGGEWQVLFDGTDLDGWKPSRDNKQFETADFIRRNVGYRREANEILGRKAGARPGRKGRTIGRLMELLEAKSASNVLIYSDHVTGAGAAFWGPSCSRASRILSALITSSV